MSTTELMKREWTEFRRPGRLFALAVAALSVIALGLVYGPTGGKLDHENDSGLCRARHKPESLPWIYFESERWRRLLKNLK